MINRPNPVVLLFHRDGSIHPITRRSYGRRVRTIIDAGSRHPHDVASATRRADDGDADAAAVWGVAG